MAIDKGTVNVIQLSITFMLQFFAYMSQEFIQEPLIESQSRLYNNIDPHAGYHSFAILYFFFTFTCLIVTPIVEKITSKWSMVFGLVSYFFFQIGFLSINQWYLYASSALLGVGGAFLWVGQGKYMTENCTGQTIERNTAVMWVIFKISLVGGGVFLFFMFQHQTLSEVVASGDFKILCFIFCGVSLVATINTICLRQPAYKPKKEPETIPQTLFSTFRLMSTLQMSLLAVLFIYAGFIRSFWIAIYPTCIKFTAKLGANTTKLLAISCIATGIGQIGAGVLFSIIGKRARIIGKDIIVFLAMLLHIAVFIVIYLYFPYDAPLRVTENTGYFAPDVNVAVLCSALLGFGDAVLQTQIYSYLCDGYSEESSHAFALFKFYSGASSALAFFLSRSFTLAMHLSLYGIFAILSGITAIVAQRVYFSKIQHFYQGNVKIAPTEKSQPIKIEITEQGSVIKN